MDEVVVTGSRIVAPNLQSISPITAIGAEELNIAGKTRIEDVLNQLPQAFAAQGSNISNASDGTASVDLRGLGAQRTLVLVNGQRMMPGDPDGGSAADLNQIPLSLVKRVDVLTGGASSVYGADAVAGVVNFVMDNEFEGVRFDYNYSFYNHTNDNEGVQDIDEARGNPAAGQLGERGLLARTSRSPWVSVVPKAVVTRRSMRPIVKSDPVLQAEFDYSSCTLNLALPAPTSTCGGSGTADPAQLPRSSTPMTARSLARRSPLGGRPPTARLRPFTATDQYNFGPINYLPAAGRALHRWRVRQLQAQRRGRRLRRIHVHGRPFGGADRALRLRSSARPRSWTIRYKPVGSSRTVRCSHGVLRSVRPWRDDDSANSSSDVATRKVAVARTTSVTSRIASSRVCAANSTTS